MNIENYMEKFKEIFDEKPELKEYIEELVEQATTDPLTGLYNRCFFEEKLCYEFERAKRYKHSLSVIISDIDDYKKYNDAHGHLKGDEVLKKIANVIKENVRSADIVCRYGGEEFVILLPETGITGARYVAERLRTSIKENTQVTASFGIASTEGVIYQEAQQLINDADRALYLAKNSGKNKVCTIEDVLSYEHF